MLTSKTRRAFSMLSPPAARIRPLVLDTHRECGDSSEGPKIVGMGGLEAQEAFPGVGKWGPKGGRFGDSGDNRRRKTNDIRGVPTVPTVPTILRVTPIGGSPQFKLGLEIARKLRRPSHGEVCHVVGTVGTDHIIESVSVYNNRCLCCPHPVPNREDCPHLRGDCPHQNGESGHFRGPEHA